MPEGERRLNCKFLCHKAGGIKINLGGPNEMIEVGPIQVVKTNSLFELSTIHSPVFPVVESVPMFLGT
jgi:hypothetical protein